MVGKAFVNGGEGGIVSNSSSVGGFGGGGSAHGNSCIGGAGAGGYSGGTGSNSYCNAGGGGGSYNNGQNQSNEAGTPRAWTGHDHSMFGFALNP